MLDNADKKADFFAEDSESASNGLAQFIPRGRHRAIILTTRDFELADELADSNVLFKYMMEEALAEQFFTQHYPAAVHHERELIMRLLRALQCLPLAIVQVAAYLRRSRACSLTNYVELFNTCQRRLLSQPFKDLRREANSETILTTLSITFRQVQEQSPLSGSLLKLIACIDRQNTSAFLRNVTADSVDTAVICVPSHARTLPVRERFVPFANILSRSRTFCPARELDPIGKLANEHEFKIQFINLKLTYTQQPSPL